MILQTPLATAGSVVAQQTQQLNNLITGYNEGLTNGIPEQKHPVTKEVTRLAVPAEVYRQVVGEEHATRLPLAIAVLEGRATATPIPAPSEPA